MSDGKYDFTWRPGLKGWFDYQAVYQQAIDGAADGAVFVEIGTAYFRSALWMAQQILASGKRIYMHCVDPWVNDPDTFGAQWFNESMREGGAFNAGLRSLLEHGTREEIELLSIHRMRSLEASTMFRNQELDFVFVDGDHRGRAPLEDIVAWFPKVKVGGVLAGHDYGPMFPGVVEAVHTAFFGDCEIRTPERGETSTWWHRVKPNTYGSKR
jgi:hypothetical protein